MDDVSLARLDWFRAPGVVSSIDGNSLGMGFKGARVLPGLHVIEYADHPAEFGIHPKGKLEAELRAGRVYRFNIKYCFWCVPRRHAVWIDDETSGELVSGRRPDWPRWYL